MAALYDQAFPRSYGQRLRDIQLQWLSAHRGRLRCPRCDGTALIRKGWRSRVLRTSRGRLSLAVLQMRCKACGRTFRPVNAVLGLPFGRRFLDELVEKAIGLGIQMPFGRASWALRALLADAPSPEGLRRQIAARAATLAPSDEVAGKTVLVDGTRVKAGKNPRGSAVYLAVSAIPGPAVAGRPTIVKRLVHVHVGDAEGLRRRLLGLPIERLVHDGGLNLEACASAVQRCRWHLVHQLNHYLWLDGMQVEQRRHYQKRLKRLLWRRGPRAPEGLDAFIKELQRDGFRQSAEHLQNAQPHAFSWQADKGFAFTTTAPLEREMRELNRRADAGPAGATAGSKTS
ncbi:MAG: hypothetical protein HPY67_16080 [Syntrophaceae bacterium]|nr:hypothetical protein [Syntrophaceae bacterium]NPV04819.1 hypothetical protein [Syntrophaceae bacterium]NPV06233.1 hypothetical protein [Syntrophaceae bacterium]